MFTEKYIRSLNSSDLRDDEFHHATDPLFASASADFGAGGVLGSLLTRVKFGNGMVRKEFEAGSSNLAQLLKFWLAEVEKKGRDRKWVKIGSERDIQAAFILYRRVAEKSLAHWLDPNCKVCNGTKVVDHKDCKACMGSGLAHIECSGGYERGKILDMISDLEGAYQSHSGRAAALIRRAA